MSVFCTVAEILAHMTADELDKYRKKDLKNTLAFLGGLNGVEK